jgi:hypothetical protein
LKTEPLLDVPSTPLPVPQPTITELERTKKTKTPFPLPHPYNHISVHFTIPSSNNPTTPFEALIDSGATDNFIDTTFLQHQGLPSIVKTKPEPFELLDGNAPSSGPITHKAQFDLSILNPDFLGMQECKFQVTKLGHFPVVLGLPWLSKVKPDIDWDNGKLLPGKQEEVKGKEITPPIVTIDNSNAPNISFIDAQAFAKAVSKKPLLCGVLTSKVKPSETGEENGLRQQVPKAYWEYLDVFSKSNADELPPHRSFDHQIPLLTSTTPPFGPIYSLSENELKVLREYLDENLKKGFICPSESPAGAPILFVKKKDGSLRLCVDYRGLNNITVKNRYPLPLIGEMLDRLRKAKVYTKIDLRGAYNLLRIAKGEERKTAFRTRYGHFEYKVMPFGLCNAPASFQHLMNFNFRDMLDKHLIIYLDDILIYSDSEEEHEEHVKQTLDRLRQVGLFAKAEKCEFSVTSVEFLGFIISSDGVSMDKKKVSSVQDWPRPVNLHEIRIFLGFTNFYRRFIKDYSTICQPLTSLTRKDVPFIWDASTEEAFVKLKEAFSSASLLCHFNPNKRLVMETDTSDYAIAGILSQPSADGVLHPIAFFSRKMAPAELNYEIHDKEMLAIISSFKEWCHYLEGSCHPVSVLTDHRSLEYFTSTKQLNRRQARWAEFLSDFDFTITYRPGLQGTKPDALTCRPDYHPMEKGSSLDSKFNPHNHRPLLKPGQFAYATHHVEIIPLLKEQLREQLPLDEEATEIIADLSDNPTAHSNWRLDKEGLLRYKDMYYVPSGNDLRLKVVQDRHDLPAAGHPGRRRTVQHVQRDYWWPRMKQFIHHFVDSCDMCGRTKKRRHKPVGELKSLPIPPYPWSSLSMDLIEFLPESNGFNSILVIVDRLTKMAKSIPTTTGLTAEELARLFVRHVFGQHGLPTDITSDRGSEFTSEFWKSLCTLLKIKLNFSTAFHPETDGQTEIVNQRVEQYLRLLTDYQQSNWSDHLPLAEFTYNNATHSTIWGVSFLCQ